MRSLFCILMILPLLALPVSALDLTAPTVPASAEKFMPRETESFGEGLLIVLRDAAVFFRPDLKEAMAICMGMIAMVLILSVIRSFPGPSLRASNLAGTVAIAGLLLKSANSMIQLAVQCVGEISEYGKLLLPVITAAMAAQGGVTASAALYAGTAFFDTVLSNLIFKLLTPMVYLFLALASANAALGEELLKKIRDFLKGFMTWLLKTVLYVFTGYISITGVVSGTTDAAALKVAKLTISSAVPVVGGILSDASEAVLVSAGTVKNAVGIYGMFAVLAIWMGPFLKIGAHYLMLKAAGAVCEIFGSKQITGLIHDFSTALGLLLAMTGTVSLMLMISMICFMKGAG